MHAQSSVSTFIKGPASDPLFTSKQASEYLGVSLDTLSVWRCVGRYSLPFIKVGRLVKYRKSALDNFLNSRTHGVEV